MSNRSYDQQTVNSPNPLARYAHRNRLKKSIDLALAKCRDGVILDYGCGSGHFIAEMLRHRPGAAVGYEPYMTERAAGGLPIHRTLDELMDLGPFSMVTLFETIEHLHQEELVDFLSTCDRILGPDGGILISGPIEIGPALLLKEVNRSILHFRKPEHGLFELAKASVLGIQASRAIDIKRSHKGFDFRKAISAIEALGWGTEILRFGPLPIRTWYGNSQFYLWATRKEPKRAALRQERTSELQAS